MNPFDVVNNDTSKNSDKNIKSQKQNKEKTKQKNVSNKARHAKNNVNTQNSTKSSKAKKTNKKLNKSTKSKKPKESSNDKLVKSLTKQYSTDRLNMYDIIRLKLLQKVNGMKSRSQLIDDMIKIVKPIYLNSPTKRKQYKSLFKYALIGLKINKKFK